MFNFLKKTKIVIGAPISGKVIALENVPDEAFSSGILGPGIAIEPSGNVVTATANGRIGTMFDTGHAVSLITDDGVEMLIHVGMDTVTLNGKNFTILRKTGEIVKKNDELIRFDKAAIAAAGLATITPVVICNADTFAEITFTKSTNVDTGDDFIYLVKGDKF